MRRKQSMMGSSKFEFNHALLDENVAAYIERKKQIKAEFERELTRMIEAEPAKMSERFGWLVEVMREVQPKYRKHFK